MLNNGSRKRDPDAPPLRVLYVEGNPDGTVGGSFFVLQDLILRLDRSRYEPVAVFRFDNFVAETLRRAGVRVFIFPPRVPLRFQWRPLHLALAPVRRVVNFFGGFVTPALAYARFLRRERIDLVNLNNSVTRNHPWMVAALLTRTTCMTHEMGINRHYSRLTRFFGRRLSAIVCVSRAVKDAVVNGGVVAPEITVVHCGIDLSRYRHVDSPDELRRRHGIAPGAPVVGVVGNVKAWKGQETIVRATGLLRARHPDIRCVLAGDIEKDQRYVRRLRAICAELGIEENVVFAGFQKNAIDYMRLMDVVAHTSTDPEPFGIVMLEAMSLAKPLVATTIGGPAEVVIDGVTGLLVEPGRPERLADAICALLADPLRAAEMGRRGRDRLRDQFTLEKNLAATLDVYSRVLERSRSRT